MVTITQFVKAQEDLEIFWLAGLLKTVDKGWRVQTATRGLASGEIKIWSLPIGLLPMLAPGRRFSGGNLLDTAMSGLPQMAVIPDLANGEEVTSEVIPQGLYSFEGQKAGVQHLFRYRLDGQEVLIPAIEMIRYLFLHNKTMANALLVPAALMALCRPESPGFHDELHLDFTREIPKVCLSPEFAKEFAWIAVHPDGRRSWDSVLERTRGQPYASFFPPPFKESRLSFRGVQHKNQWLVLEIYLATGKTVPCNQLTYSYPAARKRQTKRHAQQSTMTNDGASKIQDRMGAKRKHRQIDPESRARRRDVHQRALHVPAKFGAFDRDIPVVKMVRRGSEEDETVATTATRSTKRGSARGRIVTAEETVVSVSAQEPMVISVPPIELHLLESVSEDYLGTLEPLMEVVRMIAEKGLPLEISTAVCALKRGRPFSNAGKNRRVCLIVHFRPKKSPPSIMLDVDHTDLQALSALLLKYERPLPFDRIEPHILSLLDALVKKGGRWDLEALKKLPDAPRVLRVPRIIRRAPEKRGEPKPMEKSTEGGRDDQGFVGGMSIYYLKGRAEQLVDRLDLYGSRGPNTAGF